MDNYITAAAVKRLRETLGMTQAELAAQIGVSDKAVSKWETGKGLPDISLIEPLAGALGISVIELMNGSSVTNRNRACNMRRSRLYVCPVCANAVHATGDAVVSCCGITLPALEAEDADADHAVRVDYSDGEYIVQLEHEMSKIHHISFIAYATDASFDLVKLYPEGEALARFLSRGRGDIYIYCNRHGLMRMRVQPLQRRGKPFWET